MENKSTSIAISSLIKIRKAENLHIVFWLLKDLSWCMFWKPLGVAMVVPAVFISIYLTWKSQWLQSAWYHNMAVTCWIIANSYWMLVEFFGFENDVVGFGFSYKQLSVVPFVAGILLLLYYYVIVPKKEEDII